MRDTYISRKSCRICGSHEIEQILCFNPTPIGDAFVTVDRVNISQPTYPLDLYMCKVCGLAQIIDVINPDILYGEYIYQTSSSVGLDLHFSSYAEDVISKCDLKGGSLIVDIGSNDGTLLRKFKEQGMSVLGIEPAKHIADIANNKGIYTVTNFLTPEVAIELSALHGHAKVITANNVLANIDDLMKVAIAFDHLLAKNGVIIIESSYLLDLVQNTVFDFIYHEHLSSFSIRPIIALFKHVGMEVVDIQKVDTKGGSLRYFIQRTGGPLTKSEKVMQLLEFEDSTGLYSKVTYDHFADKIGQLKLQICAFLSKAKSEKKTIWGFGASISCTTLMYQFDISEYFTCLVDDNVAKQGLLSPGAHIPVLPTSALYENGPDIIVILAWRYAEHFIKKNSVYLESGGTVVMPVPEFKFINRIL